jgi:hypothetical protein
MGKRYDRVKQAINPPLTAAWVDMVVTGRGIKSDEIERTKGPEAAQKHREKTGRLVQKMVRRGII